MQANMFWRVLVIFSLLFSQILSSSAQTCHGQKYTFSINEVFSACNDLPYLNSSLHWNYSPYSGTLQIAFRHIMLTSRWAAWAINANGLEKAMIGAQVLVAYQLDNGSMRTFTSQITSYVTTMPEGKLIYDVSDFTATYADNEIVIYATSALPSNITTINHVWQEGLDKNDSPGTHSFDNDSTSSYGILDHLSGMQARKEKLEGRSKNVHGVVNSVSWGIMMPVSAQLMFLELLDGQTGIRLGIDSSGVEHWGHKTLGILMFILGTLNVFALLLRPKMDHKYRFYWNIYHHSVGHLVILLTIINIFKGFDILKPEKKIKNAYIGGIVALVVDALWMEARLHSILEK